MYCGESEKERRNALAVLSLLSLSTRFCGRCECHSALCSVAACLTARRDVCGVCVCVCVCVREKESNILSLLCSSDCLFSLLFLPSFSLHSTIFPFPSLPLSLFIAVKRKRVCVRACVCVCVCVETQKVLPHPLSSPLAVHKTKSRLLLLPPFPLLSVVAALALHAASAAPSCSPCPCSAAAWTEPYCWPCRLPLAPPPPLPPLSAALRLAVGPRGRRPAGSAD